MTTIRIIGGAVLVGVGVALSLSPQIGGQVTVGFCLFVAGVVLAAGAIVDVLEAD